MKHTNNCILKATNKVRDLVTGNSEALKTLLDKWTYMPVAKGVVDGVTSLGSFIFYLSHKAIAYRGTKRQRISAKAKKDFGLIQAGCNGMLFNQHKFVVDVQLHFGPVYNPITNKYQHIMPYAEFTLLDAYTHEPQTK